VEAEWAVDVRLDYWYSINAPGDRFFEFTKYIIPYSELPKCWEYIISHDYKRTSMFPGYGSFFQK
jgi:hypothetical protein